MEIKIFTDGASKKNPGPSGWGTIVETDNHVNELGGREEHSTNNRMELTAVIEGLNFVSESEDPIQIFTDSSYVINNAPRVSSWREKNWISSAKTEILNKDLWEKLSEAMEGKQIEWKYVGGHIGIAGNDRADRIASNFADGIKVELYDGPLSGYEVDILNIDFDETAQAKKSAGRARSKMTAYSYVSELDGVIQVHKTWAETEARVKGKPARFKKATSPEEEKQIIEEFSKPRQ